MTDSLQSLDNRQVELQTLQREYRHMEINRRAYAEESQAVLRKQQSAIDKFRKDNENLRSEIALLMRSSSRPLSTLQQGNLNKMHEDGERYSSAIEFERNNIQIMEEQIHIMRQRVLQQRRAMGGINASRDNNQMIQKQIRILENRLQKALVKFNEAIAQNKTLRDSIDNLRRERVAYESIYRKLERELKESKDTMAEIIEASNHSYEQRDSYHMEVTAIEQANRKEQEEFEEQMMESGRLLDTELRMPVIDGTLGASASRQQLTRYGSAEKSLKGENSALRLTGDVDFQLSVSSKSKTAAVRSAPGIDRIQNFEEAFYKISAATGIRDVDELVKTFIHNEDHNFSLFTYVNEQNNEIERCDEQLQLLQEEERKFTQESGDDIKQHKLIIKELEEKLLSAESMAEKYETRCQDLKRLIESMKRGIQSTYEKFGSSEESITEHLVTESIMVQFLGLIEQKSNTLLHNYAVMKLAISDLTAGGAASVAYKETNIDSISESRDKESNHPKQFPSVLGVGPKIPMGHEQLHVNPPRLEEYQSDDEENDDEDNARPLTRDELKTRTLHRLQRLGSSRAATSQLTSSCTKKGGVSGGLSPQIGLARRASLTKSIQK